MKVSVIVRTYNRAYILREALESALAQTYRDCEIVVVDDGSTDNTTAIVRSFRSERIRYLQHEKNRGVGAACNSGISAATGELIAFLDSDDLWNPEYLERQVQLLSRHPEADAVFSDVEIVGEKATVPSLIALMRCFPSLLDRDRGETEYVFSGRQMYLCLLEELPIKPTALVVRREVFAKAGTFDETVRSGEDWEFLLRLSRSARFGYNDVRLAVQRRTLDATHRMFREEDKLLLLSIFLKEKAGLGDDSEAISSVNRGLCGLYNSLAWAYLESGRATKAMSVYWEGLMQTLQPKLLRKLLAAPIHLVLNRVIKARDRASAAPFRE